MQLLADLGVELAYFCQQLLLHFVEVREFLLQFLSPSLIGMRLLASCYAIISKFLYFTQIFSMYWFRTVFSSLSWARSSPFLSSLSSASLYFSESCCCKWAISSFRLSSSRSKNATRSCILHVLPATSRPDPGDYAFPACCSTTAPPALALSPSAIRTTLELPSALGLHIRILTATHRHGL